MNSVNLTGRLSKDPELRHTASGVPYCYVSIAVSRDQKPKEGEPDADWPTIALWRQSAEFVCDYASKGDLLIVNGRIKTRTGNDGQKITEVVADRVELGGSKKSGSSGSTRKSPSTAKRQQLPTATPEQIAQWEFEETGKVIDPDDLPF